MIEYAKCTDGFVIEPYKYYPFVGEEIYHDSSTGFIIHFDQMETKYTEKANQWCPVTHVNLHL